jgi:Tol biopolymer transport system component
VPAFAQQSLTKKFDLTIDNIMRGPDLVGYEPSRPYWSQDGQRLYFASRQPDGWQVRRLTLSSGVVENVTSDGGFVALESRDGQWLYYSRNDRAGLWRMPTNGGATSRVTARLLPEDSGGWGVLDDGVYWLERRDDADAPPELVVARADGSAPQRLAVVPEMAWPGVDVSPDGRRVLYSRLGRHDSNIVVLSLRPPG